MASITFRWKGYKGGLLDIFLTGATGFIGHRLVRRLAQTEHTVRCLVRPTSDTRRLDYPNVRLVRGDVTDPAVLEAGMAGCDWVIHLANLYAMWLPDRSQFARVNIEGTRQVMDCALRLGVKKVVYVSTVAVYGKPQDVPFTEESARGPVQFSEYGRTKAEGERIAWETARRGLPLTVLYPGIVLGADDNKASGVYIQGIIHRSVPSTIFHKAYATYAYVGDVVEAILRAAEKPETVGQKYLVGGETLSGKDYVQMISQVSGVPLPWLHLPDWFVIAGSYVFNAISDVIKRFPPWGFSIDASRTLSNGFRCDGSKAARELGITYTPIRQALKEAVESYRNLSSNR